MRVALTERSSSISRQLGGKTVRGSGPSANACSALRGSGSVMGMLHRRPPHQRNMPIMLTDLTNSPEALVGETPARRSISDGQTPVRSDLAEKSMYCWPAGQPGGKTNPLYEGCFLDRCLSCTRKIREHNGHVILATNSRRKHAHHTHGSS